MPLIRSFALAMALALPLVTPTLLRADQMTMAAPVRLGPLILSGGFARATLPNAPVAGGFLTIENTGTEDDTLIGAATSIAGHMEVHEMAMKGDVMQMRELEGGLPVPAGQTVVLKPGGFHIMFMDLKEPLVQGGTVMVTFTFARAGSIGVPLTIGAPNAKSMGGEDHSHQGNGTTGDTGHAAPHSAAGHAAPAGFDQTAVQGDDARIEGLLRATFETAERPLALDPLLIAGDRAVVGWVQGDMGGRALLEKDSAGLWRVVLCAGEGLKGQTNMEAMGVPAGQAGILAAAQAKAEAMLPPETVALLDSFGEPVRF